jgi:hypothetical protein
MRLCLSLIASSLLVLAAGCVTIGPSKPLPRFSQVPSAGNAACASECSVLGGCKTSCGYGPPL